MTCDRFNPSSLMRSTTSVDVFEAADFAAGVWAGRDGAAGGWALSTKAGTRPVAPSRTAKQSGRLMMGISGRIRGMGTRGLVRDEVRRHTETGERLGPGGSFYEVDAA